MCVLSYMCNSATCYLQIKRTPSTTFFFLYTGVATSIMHIVIVVYVFAIAVWQPVKDLCVLDPVIFISAAHV